jgi:hypothetical protein
MQTTTTPTVSCKTSTQTCHPQERHAKPPLKHATLKSVMQNLHSNMPPSRASCKTTTQTCHPQQRPSLKQNADPPTGRMMQWCHNGWCKPDNQILFTLFWTAPSGNRLLQISVAVHKSTVFIIIAVPHKITSGQGYGILNKHTARGPA